MPTMGQKLPWGLKLQSVKRKQPLPRAIHPQVRETHRDTEIDSSEVKHSKTPRDTGEEASGLCS